MMTPSVATLVQVACSTLVLRGDRRQAFREGVIDEAPVIPGTGYVHAVRDRRARTRASSAATSGLRPEFLHSLHGVHDGLPDKRSEAGHEISDLLSSAITASGLVEAKRAAWYDLVPAWSDEVRSVFKASSAAGDLAAVATQAASALPRVRTDRRARPDRRAIASFRSHVRVDLRLRGEARERIRRDVLRHHRPVEVHGLHAVRRGLGPHA